MFVFLNLKTIRKCLCFIIILKRNKTPLPQHQNHSNAQEIKEAKQSKKDERRTHHPADMAIVLETQGDQSVRHDSAALSGYRATHTLELQQSDKALQKQDSAGRYRTLSDAHPLPLLNLPSVQIEPCFQCPPAAGGLHYCNATVIHIRPRADSSAQ
jgi:hypothetical protein